MYFERYFILEESKGKLLLTWFKIGKGTAKTKGSMTFSYHADITPNLTSPDEWSIATSRQTLYLKCPMYRTKSLDKNIEVFTNNAKNIFEEKLREMYNPMYYHFYLRIFLPGKKGRLFGRDDK